MKYYLECTLQVSMYFLIKMELIMVFECLLFVISALHTGVVQRSITCKQLTKELRLQSEEPRWAPKFLPTWDNFFYHSNASLFLFLEFSWYTMSVQHTDSANLHVDMVFSTIAIITVLKIHLKLIVKKTASHFSTIDFAGRAWRKVSSCRGSWFSVIPKLVSKNIFTIWKLQSYKIQ